MFILLKCIAFIFPIVTKYFYYLFSFWVTEYHEYQFNFSLCYSTISATLELLWADPEKRNENETTWKAAMGEYLETSPNVPFS